MSAPTCIADLPAEILTEILLALPFLDRRLRAPRVCSAFAAALGYSRSSNDPHGINTSTTPALLHERIDCSSVLDLRAKTITFPVGRLRDSFVFVNAPNAWLRLQSLALISCADLTDAALVCLARTCIQLHTIRLELLTGVGVIGVGALSNLPLLERVALIDLSYVTLPEIAASLAPPRMRELALTLSSLNRCPDYAHQLCELAERNAHLTRLQVDVRDCSPFSPMATHAAVRSPLESACLVALTRTHMKGRHTGKEEV